METGQERKIGNTNHPPRRRFTWSAPLSSPCCLRHLARPLHLLLLLLLLVLLIHLVIRAILVLYHIYSLYTLARYLFGA